MTITLCPNGHYYDSDRFPACPYCHSVGSPDYSRGTSPTVDIQSQAGVTPLPQGTVLGGKYLLESSQRKGGELRYTATDIRRGERVYIREYADRDYRDADGTLRGSPLPADFADRFLKKYPQATDSFLQNATVYAVLEEDIPDPDPFEGTPFPPIRVIYGPPPMEKPVIPAKTVDIMPLTPPKPVFFTPEPDPELSEAEPRTAPAVGTRVADPRLICRKCMHVSPTPFNRCPVCGQWWEPRLSARAPRGGLPLRTVLAGKFLVEDLLYSDEEHHVYAGWDLYASRPVELIEYFPTYLARRVSDDYLLELLDEDGSSVEKQFDRGLDRFASCARLYRRFGGRPGVPELAEAFYENNTAYIAAYLEEGRTLAELIPPEGMEPGTLLAVLRDIAEGTRALRLQGGAHAGISAESIFVAASGRAFLLTPFGATRPPAEFSSSRLYGYMYAPLAETQSLSPAADVWSLAVTALAALSGKNDGLEPFLRGDAEPDVSGVRDPDAQQLIARVLSDLEDRPSTPEEFVNALQACFVTES